jgi:hypothetical protein
VEEEVARGTEVVMMAGINGSIATVFAGGSPIAIFTKCYCKGLASVSSGCFSPGFAFLFQFPYGFQFSTQTLLR